MGDDLPPTKGFREECEFLAPLETFDPAAFVGDANVPQEVCNFVLALSLIYNDCKNAVYAHVALSGLKPGATPAKTRLWGTISGVQWHAFRAVVAVINELFKLISEKQKQGLLEHHFFKSIVRGLSPPSREAWLAVVAVACDKRPTNELSKKLLRVRHKVIFHYDPDEIYKGYAHHFIDEPTKRGDRAYISRGTSMRTTRFYFADAAVSGYLRHLAGAKNDEELQNEVEEVFERVNHGLMMIVEAFIQRRRYAFRKEAEQ